MSIQDFYDVPVAVNPDTGQLQPSSEFQVFAVTDVGFTTPLAVTEPESGAAINPLRSSSIGVLPQFRVAGDPPQVIIRSGAFTTLLASRYGILTEAGWDPALATAAVEAAGEAGEALAETIAAKEAVEGVVATNDGIMTAVAADPESTFSGEIDARIDEALEGFTPGNPIAVVYFGIDLTTPRPDAIVVIWQGQLGAGVPVYKQTSDQVWYGEYEEVIPPWMLEDVPGLAIDFNAQDLVGVVADGATVSGHWVDAVSGKIATHISSASATFDADGFNGHPAVSFPNGGVLRAAGYANYTGPSTVFLLAQCTDAALSDFFIDGVDGAAAVLKLGIGVQSGTFRAQRSTALSFGTADVSPHLVEVVFNGATSSGRIDGGATTSGSTTASEGFVDLIIGGRGGDTNRLTGKIARVVIVHGLVSAEDRAQIRAMLTTQGGLT